MRERSSKPLFGESGNSLILLIAILAIVFCLFKFLQLVYTVDKENTDAAIQHYRLTVFNKMILPARLEAFLSQVWSFFTYMFFEFDVFSLISNLIWLWVFGFILQDLSGNRSIFPIFIYSSLVGAAIFLITMNLVPAFKPYSGGSYLLGASTGVMGIAVATTVLAPNYRLFPMILGGIPLWVITVIFVLIDFARVADQIMQGTHISQLAAAAFGFIYMNQWKKGNDWGNGMNRFFNWFGNLFTPPKPAKETFRGAYFYDTEKTPFKKVPNLTQQRIDAILDKIGKEGYNRLSDEEKEILKRAANDDSL
ncbi:MAG: rhomboid family intramembrane serine protease [Chitinophagaceae bacterium]|uniref:rhomboid family intramembrane serine protease n=1 Tax=unclassified Paraflavitalea TaxID=2798305 RepID=UPI003D332000|nr:rhomboid family intramembrane serine protease [Chitinophagaceae bacterium]